MSPHRSDSLVGYAAGSVKSLASVPGDSSALVSTAAVGAVAFGWLFGAANTVLFWVVGGAMLLDLVAGAMKAVVDPLDHFSIAKLYGGILGKLFRMLLIPTASAVDWLFIASAMPLPSGYEDAFPVTAGAMVALALAEIISILDKLRQGGVAPQAIAVVMRQLDRMKIGAEPPMRRDYDQVAVEAERELEAEGRPVTKRPDRRRKP